MISRLSVFRSFIHVKIAMLDSQRYTLYLNNNNNNNNNNYFKHIASFFEL